MNCEQYQETILESLGSGADRLPPEVAAHRQACPACRELYEKHARLYRSIDAGLCSMVNQQVPPSLLPGLRARLGQQRLARRAWIPSWSFAFAVAAVAILAVSVGYFRRPPESHPNLPEGGLVGRQFGDNSVPGVKPPRQVLVPSPSRVHKGASSPAPSEAAPEVIVLAEERQAFAKFVAELPEETDLALALTRPAPPAVDAPVEIALLEIESLEVKPLEVTPRE
jgi:hypothetical protein